MAKIKLGTVKATNMGISKPPGKEPVLWTVWSDGTAAIPVDPTGDWAVPQVEAKRHEGKWYVKYLSSKNGIDGYVTIDSDVLEAFYKNAISGIIEGSIGEEEGEV